LKNSEKKEEKDSPAFISAFEGRNISAKDTGKGKWRQ
jgi:hypothetical protein